MQPSANSCSVGKATARQALSLPLSTVAAPLTQLSSKVRTLVAPQDTGSRGLMAPQRRLITVLPLGVSTGTSPMGAGAQRRCTEREWPLRIDAVGHGLGVALRPCLQASPCCRPATATPPPGKA